ncbi:unnamed protein product [Heterobilharzia americana]|nr:unnamed protein product [Heterobilharzia americana]
MNDAPDGKRRANDSLNKRNINDALRVTTNLQKSAHPCTILEYRWPFVELPSWYVDLREHTEVNGVVIYTAGHGRDGRYLLSSLFGGEDKTKLSSENLERLSIYVESEPRHRDSKTLSRSSSSLCGFVTRLNDAIFSPRLHIPCRQPLLGRYVYVEARGQCISSYCAPIQCFKTCNFRYRYLHSRKVNRSADSSTSEKLENITQGNPTDYDQLYCAFHSFIPSINFSLAPKKSLLGLFEPSELTDTLEVRHLSPGCELPSEPFTVTNQHLNTTLYLLADFLQLKLDDGNLEPVFGSAFLYDVHSRQKVTETFHFDVNSNKLMNLLTGSMTNQQLAYRDASSLAQTCLFRISSRYSLSNATDLNSSNAKSNLKSSSNGGSSDKIGLNSNGSVNECESDKGDEFDFEDVLTFASSWNKKQTLHPSKISCCKGGLFLIIRVEKVLQRGDVNDILEDITRMRKVKINLKVQ